jgi:hypothetical protein
MVYASATGATMTQDGARMPWPASQRGEHRQFRRLPLALPVTLRDAQGELCAARLVDLSPTGLRLDCDEATARRLLPAGGVPEPGREPILQVLLELPNAGRLERLSLGVRLVHATLRPAHCLLGFSYLSLRPRARRIVAEFFGELPPAVARETRDRAG